MYLPPDANSLALGRGPLSAEREYVNVIVAGKQPALQYLSMDAGESCIAPAGSAFGNGRVATIRRGTGRGNGCCGDIPLGDPGREVRPDSPASSPISRCESSTSWI